MIGYCLMRPERFAEALQAAAAIDEVGLRARSVEAITKCDKTDARRAISFWLHTSRAPRPAAC